MPKWRLLLISIAVLGPIVTRCDSHFSNEKRQAAIKRDLSFTRDANISQKSLTCLKNLQLSFSCTSDIKGRPAYEVANSANLLFRETKFREITRKPVTRRYQPFLPDQRLARDRRINDVRRTRNDEERLSYTRNPIFKRFESYQDTRAESTRNNPIEFRTRVHEHKYKKVFSPSNEKTKGQLIRQYFPRILSRSKDTQQRQRAATRLNLDKHDQRMIPIEFKVLAENDRERSQTRRNTRFNRDGEVRSLNRDEKRSVRRNHDGHTHQLRANTQRFEARTRRTTYIERQSSNRQDRRTDNHRVRSEELRRAQNDPNREAIRLTSFRRMETRSSSLSNREDSNIPANNRAFDRREVTRRSNTRISRNRDIRGESRRQFTSSRQISNEELDLKALQDATRGLTRRDYNANVRLGNQRKTVENHYAYVRTADKRSNFINKADTASFDWKTYALIALQVVYACWIVARTANHSEKKFKIRNLLSPAFYKGIKAD